MPASMNKADDDDRLEALSLRTVASARVDRRANTTRGVNVNSRSPGIVRPDKLLGAEPSWSSSLGAVVKASWLNVLLVFVPVSWILHFVWRETQNTVVFVVSFLAVLPLVKLLDLATEQVSLRAGEIIGGFLDTTLGNIMDIIFAIILLRKCQLSIIQYSLVGALIRNLLFLSGLCFFVGGTRFAEQGFVALAGQLNRSLLMLSVTTMLFPVAFHYSMTARAARDRPSNFDEGAAILTMSRAVACILLFVYAAYVVFQLCTHSHLYMDGLETDFKSTRYPSKRRMSARSLSWREGKIQPTAGLPKQTAPEEENRDDAYSVTSLAATLVEHSASNRDVEAGPPANEEERVAPKLNIGSAIILLITTTVLVSFSAEFLVDSINGMTESTGISQEWTGLILLPIVSKAAEHVKVVTSSVKKTLTHSLAVAHGSSIQIALLVIPLLIIAAWIIDKPLSLLFDPFVSVSLFLALLTMSYIIGNGKTNWFEGLVLIGVYLNIAIAFWFYPAGTKLQTTLGLLCPDKPFIIALNWFVAQIPL